MKIGIFGGSFNPIHNAHIDIVKYILEKLDLDKIIVIPVGKPSHKSMKLADDRMRYKMCELAFSGMDKVEISDIEINDKSISYTIETLNKLREIYGEDNEYFEIVGEDCIDTLDTWKDYKEILKLSKMIVFKRFEDEHKRDDENIIYLNTPLFKISSTMLREKIRNKEDIKDYVPEEIEKLILEENLYSEI